MSTSTAAWAVRYIERYHLALVQIPPGHKAPLHPEWNKPGGYVTDAEEAQQRWDQLPDHGIGAVLSPSGLCSLDVDSPEHAGPALSALGLDLAVLRKVAPTIQGNPARYRLVFKVPPGVVLGRKALVWPARQEVEKPLTLFELRAGDVQDVLPPTIHPETGEPYVWLTPPNSEFPLLPKDLLELWQHWDSYRKELEAMCPWAKHSFDPQPAPRGDGARPNVIAAFNLMHSGEELLAKYHYTPRGNRWVSPTSSSGLAGVVVLDGRVYSHHASDPLADGHAHDAFDLFRIIEHGRDTRAAVSAAAEELGMAAGAAQGDARRHTEGEKAPAGDEPRLGDSEARIHHDRVVTLGELFGEPEEAAQWLVEGLFPAAGFSVLAAKPKVGKSTLARQLALAVARGELFLGRETTQGPVLYVALEEKRGQVRAHFRAMGAVGDESIHIYVASAPENAIAWLSRQIERVHPVLVIIDPLFRLARVRDASAYAEVTAAMEPLLGLARTTGAHVLVTHHTTKRGEGSDAILGSTAIFGSVDTAAVLVRSERYRSIATTQRYGEDLPETVLAWDPATRTGSLSGTREEAEIDRLGKAILEYLYEKKEPVTEALINEEIEGRTGPKKKALRVLVHDKRVTRTGGGKRGEPFLYVSSSVVPTYSGEPGNQKSKDDLSVGAASSYSGSQDHANPGGSGNQQNGAKPSPGSWGTRL